MNFVEKLRQNYSNSQNQDSDIQSHNKEINSLIEAVVRAVCFSSLKVSASKRQLSGYFQKSFWGESENIVSAASRGATVLFYNDKKTVECVNYAKKKDHVTYVGIEPLYDRNDTLKIVNGIKEQLINKGFINPIVRINDTKGIASFGSFTRKISGFNIYVELKW